MKSLLIIEPYMNGHHGVHLRSIVDGAIKKGFHVMIGTFSESVQHPIFKAMMSESSQRPTIIAMASPRKNYALLSGFTGLIQREIFYREIFKEAHQKASKTGRVDFVLIPYLDYCTYATGLLGSPFADTPWAGLVMRPAFHYAAMGAVGPRSRLLPAKKVIFFRLFLQERFRLLFTIDPLLFEYLKKSPKFSKKIVYLPDPVVLNGQISRQEARQRFQIPTAAVVILVYGAVSFRKGIDLLIAAAGSHGFPKDVHIMIAGKQDSEVADFFSSPLVTGLESSGRLHILDKFLNSEEEYAAFKASDMVWLGYRGHYTMSGVLVQAAAMGLPIIACKEGLIGWYAQNFRLGPIMGDLNTKEINAAIRAIVKGEYAFETGRKSSMTWLEAHSRENFVNTCIGAITEAIGG